MNARTSSASRPILGLFAWFGLVAAAATLASFASLGAPEFYRALARPAWAPPASVFGPVWTALYAMMAFAAWLVWREADSRHGRIALALFLVQLALNVLWSWLFFAWHLGMWSVIDIAILWCAIVATIYAFWHVRPLAAALLLPYLAWVKFAAALNFTVWRLNPALLG